MISYDGAVRSPTALPWDEWVTKEITALKAEVAELHEKLDIVNSHLESQALREALQLIDKLKGMEWEL